MRAMILAAGRGERMRPLTDTCPKPLLNVAEKALIEHHIDKLVAVGITDIVINCAWLGEKIVQTLGDGSQYGAHITYSHERQGALETAGGIAKALALLGNAPFLVINGDIFIEYDFTQLVQLNENELAHLYLTSNPAHNPSGDFYLINQKVIHTLNYDTQPLPEKLTFSGVAIYHPDFFQQVNAGEKLSLAPMLKQAADAGKIGGTYLSGLWTDVGTPERLSQLNKRYAG